MAEVNFKNIELVDRKEELTRLKENLENAYSGKGATVFISGEAGIGKTRIVEELIVQAEQQNFRIIRGQCLPESIEPMFPFKSALKRAGLEYLLSNKPPPFVLSAYLIDSSGLVIAKAERTETNLDPDIFVGMLTAIEAFVKDSLKIMGTEENATLNSLSYGDYNIIIQSSGNLSLATVIKGEPNEFLIEDMKRILENLEERFEDWHGDMERAEEAVEDVAWFINSQKYDGRYLAGEPMIMQENIFDNLLMGLQRLSEKTPLIVFIDDLQWADKTTLNFLYYLSRNMRRSRALIIGTYRPEEILPSGGELHPLEVTINNLAGEGLLEVIGLQRLSKEDTFILISRILGDFTQELGEKVYRESGGNPLFVIETIKLLLTERMIYREGNRWHLKKGAEKIIVPKKAYELIKRRLERLTDGEREIMDVASVIGEEFDISLLSLTTMMDELKILKMLNNIYRKHKLIYIDDGKYRFEHSIIREVLYNELLDDLRRKYHKIIGDIIYELHRDNIEPVINLLAHHYYEARDRKAVEFLLTLGDQARSNYANYEALEFYRRALELVGDEKTKLKLLENMGDVLVYTGDYEAAEEHYRDALSIAKDPNAVSRLNRKIADTHSKRGDYEGALKILKSTLENLPRGFQGERGRLYKDMAALSNILGDHQEALELYRKALKIFTTIKNERDKYRRDLAEILRGVGNIHLLLGNIERAKRYFTKALEIVRDLGDMKSVAEVLSDMGDMYLSRRDLDRALKIYTSSLNAMNNVGYKFGIASLLNKIGSVYYLRGDMDIALDYFHRSLDISERINQRGAIAEVLNNIGNILLLMDEGDEALKKFAESLKISKDTGDKRTSAHALLNTGRVYLVDGNVDYACRIIKKALSMMREVGDIQGQMDSLLSLAECELLSSKSGMALEHATDALHMALEMGDREGEMRARVVLGMVYRERGQYRKAVIELTKSLRYFNMHSNNLEIARIHYEFGVLWKKMGERAKARENLLRALELFSEKGIKLWARLCKERLQDL